MPEVRPFRGVRYAGRRPFNLSRLVTAPYDVISPEDQADYYQRDPANAIRLELAQATSEDSEQNSRYTRSAAAYRQWRAGGRLRVDSSPSFYLIQESYQEPNGEERIRATLFALVRLYNWEERQVLPHERTTAKPKADRLNLLRACQAQFSPVYALYDDPDRSLAELLGHANDQPIDAVVRLNPPRVVAAPKVTRLWQVSDPATVQAIAEALSSGAIYIADGHHRYETALAYRDEMRSAGRSSQPPPAGDYVMMALSAVEDPGVQILATHRLVCSAGPPDYQSLIAALGPDFESRRLTESEVDWFLRHPDDSALRVVAVRAGEADLLGLRLNADPTTLAAMPVDRHQSWKRLDVSCLHELVLKPNFGIGETELESGGLVEYTRDAGQVIEQVRAGRFNWGFILRPTRLKQVREVALAGEKMPPKSTYFYPKTVAGLVFFDHREAW